MVVGIFLLNDVSIVTNYFAKLFYVIELGPFEISRFLVVFKI